MSSISVKLVTPSDFQRWSCLVWIFLKDALNASSLSVGAMGCRMCLERKQLFNWCVSVGDTSFGKPTDFFVGLRGRGRMLHFLKNLTLIHYSYSLRFKLNCHRFPLSLLSLLTKPFELYSLQHLLFNAPFIQWTSLSVATDNILPLHFTPFEHCGGFAIDICHWQFVISPWIFMSGRMIPRIPFAIPIAPLYLKDTLLFLMSTISA